MADYGGYSIDQVLGALREADKARDTAAATRLAEIARSMGAEAPKPELTMGRAGKLAMEGGAQGIANLAGLPVDTFNAIDAVSVWANRKINEMLGRPDVNAFGQPVRSIAAPAGGSQTFQELGRDIGAIGNVAPETGTEKLIVEGAKGASSAAALPFGGGIPAMAGRALTGASAGLGAEAAGQATAGSKYEPYARLAGGLAGGVAPGLAARAITPFPSRLTPEKQRLVGVAEAEGIPLTPADVTGSKTLQLAEATLSRGPGSSGVMARDAQKKITAFNKAVLSKAGINADAATPDILASAKGDFGRRFKDASAAVQVKIDAPVVNALDNVMASHTFRNLPVNQKEIVTSYVEELKDAAAIGGGVIAGDMYQGARSALGRQAKGMTDPRAANALKDIQRIIDNAAESSMPANLKGVWSKLRKEYEAFKTIEKTMAGGSAGAAEGNISGAGLWAAQKGSAGNNIASGQGRLNDLARVGQSFVKPQVPTSGTSEQNAMRMLLSGATGAGGYAVGGPVGGVIGAAAPIALPWAAAQAYTNPLIRRYLSNQALAGIGTTNLGLAPVLMHEAMPLLP